MCSSSLAAFTAYRPGRQSPSGSHTEAIVRVQRVVVVQVGLEGLDVEGEPLA
jgi:hypothetical protein